MSDYPPAKTRDGRPYDGHKKFIGAGLMRSCGRCGTHRAQQGGRKVPGWGWVAVCCVPKGAISA